MITIRCGRCHSSVDSWLVEWNCIFLLFIYMSFIAFVILFSTLHRGDHDIYDIRLIDWLTDSLMVIAILIQLQSLNKNAWMRETCNVNTSHSLYYYKWLICSYTHNMPLIWYDPSIWLALGVDVDVDGKRRLIHCLNNMKWCDAALIENWNPNQN